VFIRFWVVEQGFSVFANPPSDAFENDCCYDDDANAERAKDYCVLSACEVFVEIDGSDEDCSDRKEERNDADSSMSPVEESAEFVVRSAAEKRVERLKPREKHREKAEHRVVGGGGVVAFSSDLRAQPTPLMSNKNCN